MNAASRMIAIVRALEAECVAHEATQTELTGALDVSRKALKESQDALAAERRDNAEAFAAVNQLERELDIVREALRETERERDAARQALLGSKQMQQNTLARAARKPARRRRR